MAVYREIQRKDDELFKWARENREMFEKGGDDEAVDLAAKLMKKHGKMATGTQTWKGRMRTLLHRPAAWPQAGSARSRSQ